MDKVDEIEYCGLILDVDYTYEDGEPQTYEYAGSAPEVNIHQISLEKHDITDIVSDSAREYFESYIIKHNI
jgi:hypothetical protein